MPGIGQGSLELRYTLTQFRRRAGLLDEQDPGRVVQWSGFDRIAQPEGQHGLDTGQAGPRIPHPLQQRAQRLVPRERRAHGVRGPRGGWRTRQVW